MLVKSCYSTLSHTVVLSVDYVELFTGVDNGFNDLLSFCFVPGSGLLNNFVHLSGCELSVKSTGTSDLSVGTHSTLNVYYVVLGKVLIK